MTIPSSTSRINILCDGVTTVFAVPLQAYSASDFLVTLTLPLADGGTASVLNENIDYSMVAASSDTPPKWSMTTLDAAPFGAGYMLQVILNPSQSQPNTFPSNQIPSAALQATVDRLAQMVIRLQDQVSRSVRAPDGDLNPVMLMPTAGQRLNASLMTDGNGNLAFGIPNNQNVTLAMLSGFLELSQTGAELAAGVFPTNTAYQPGDWRRYGADPTGVADSSAAAIQAGSCNGTCYVYPGTYKLNANVNHPAALVVYDGATIVPQAGFQFSPGLITAGPYQIFNLAAAGSVVILPRGITSVPAEWWGAQALPSAKVNNDVPINQAIAAMSNVNNSYPGGEVTLERGYFYLTNTILMADNVTLRGKGKFATYVGNGNAAGNQWAANATYPQMFRIYNAAGSPMFCPIIGMRLDAGSDTSVTAVVYGPSWQEGSGFDSCFIENFCAYGFYSDDSAGGARGGAAQLTFRQTQFSAAATNNNGSCIRIVYQALVGWLCLNLDEVQCNGAAAYQNVAGVNVTGRVIVNCLDYHAEALTQAVLLDTAACVKGNSVKVDGSATVTDVFYMQPTWTGSVDLASARKCGATTFINDNSRAIVGLAAAETYNGELHWPPNPVRVVAHADVTGAGVPVLAYAQGISAVANIGVGIQQLTLNPTMDGTTAYDVVPASQDNGHPMICAVKQTANTFYIYTFTAAGVAGNAAEFSVDVHRRGT